MPRNLVRSIALLGATLGAAAPAHAQRAGAPAHHAVARARAEAIALARVPGTVRAGELEREHGRWVYSFQIETPRRVRMEVNVDADTGQVVEVSRE